MHHFLHHAIVKFDTSECHVLYVGSSQVEDAMFLKLTENVNKPHLNLRS